MWCELQAINLTTDLYSIPHICITWPTHTANITLDVTWSDNVLKNTNLLVEFALMFSKLAFSLLKLCQFSVENLSVVVQLLALLKKLRCRHNRSKTRLLSHSSIPMTVAVPGWSS